MFLEHSGTWANYWSKKLGRFDGPEVRGSTLCYQSTTPGVFLHKRRAKRA